MGPPVRPDYCGERGYNRLAVEFDPEKYHRRSIRLRGYDYSQPGAYFVTICAHGKERLFGEVVEWEMVLNDAGKMVRRWWEKLAQKFPGVCTDAMVVMPNHIHGIIVLVGADPRVRPGEIGQKEVGADPRVRPGESAGKEGGGMGPPLPRVVQWFKTMTTNDYLRNFRAKAGQSSSGKLWHRNYYEHIVRDPRELEIIREYIHANHARWHMDVENA